MDAHQSYYKKPQHLHSLVIYRTSTPLGWLAKCTEGYFGGKKLFYLFIVRKWRRENFRQFSCLLPPLQSCLATSCWQPRAHCQAALPGEQQHRACPGPELLCSSASFAAAYFSKLFAQTYNNIIQRHRGAKKPPSSNTEMPVLRACWELTMTSSSKPAKPFTSHSLKYFVKMLF